MHRNETSVFSTAEELNEGIDDDEEEEGSESVARRERRRSGRGEKQEIRYGSRCGFERDEWEGGREEGRKEGEENEPSEEEGELDSLMAVRRISVGERGEVVASSDMIPDKK